MPSEWQGDSCSGVCGCETHIWLLTSLTITNQNIQIHKLYVQVIFFNLVTSSAECMVKGSGYRPFEKQPHLNGVLWGYMYWAILLMVIYGQHLQGTLCYYFPGGNLGLHSVFEISIFKEIRLNVSRSIHINPYIKYLIQKCLEHFFKISSLLNGKTI